MFSDTQRRWLVLLAFLPVVIDMTILHIAVPSLTQVLGASATEVLWIIDIYPLLMPGLLALVGAMIMPCVLGTIRRTFQEENERAIALGQWETVRVAGRSSGR
ncbi:hypothetical protein [Aeromonas dhakensis]|uniref:hypothetical protein n=1 Tax=Aeromonas dhakensis TaxID=196024 RepID=UPI00195A74E6|nr:hypothetical protein [Aeromonas dhakensis]